MWKPLEILSRTKPEIVHLKNLQRTLKDACPFLCSNQTQLIAEEVNNEPEHEKQKQDDDAVSEDEHADKKQDDDAVSDDEYAGNRILINLLERRIFPLIFKEEYL